MCLGVPECTCGSPIICFLESHNVYYWEPHKALMGASSVIVGVPAHIYGSPSMYLWEPQHVILGVTVQISGSPSLHFGSSNMYSWESQHIFVGAPQYNVKCIFKASDCV